MTIPDAQTLMRPILAYLADGQAKSAKDVIAAMSDEFGLSDDERAQMLPSGRQRTMYDRVHWSLTHMSQAGLLDRPTRGHVQVTDTGRQVLKAHPERVDMAVLRSTVARVPGDGLGCPHKIFVQLNRGPLYGHMYILVSDMCV